MNRRKRHICHDLIGHLVLHSYAAIDTLLWKLTHQKYYKEGLTPGEIKYLEATRANTKEQHERVLRIYARLKR